MLLMMIEHLILVDIFCVEKQKQKKQHPAFPMNTAT